MTVLGISRGHATPAAAEHWVYDLVSPAGRGGVVACTHLVRAPHPHVAVSIEGLAGAPAEAGDPALAEAAELAAAAHTARTGGRAVLYPGVELLVGTLTVADLLAASAIERVTVIGGPPAAPDSPVRTRDFVRPQWMDGRLTLVTTPVAGGGIAPFEVPNPTPCCADHA
ncbi:hypothetical protein [Rhizomonospora bruguierae]|uniref:hypothetical protein n=1 Tax=Rhizomonospora bruguierae TaxID=1581705 RepID=UPI001BCA8099|nr:hypothetical protein [Micromonospora sp. NBRC 107566]